MTASSRTMSSSALGSAGDLPKTAEEQKSADKAAEAKTPQPKQLDALHTEHGDTRIADQVVVKIAGIATREVAGVYAMGSATGRAFSSLAQRMPGGTGSTAGGGVSIEKGERQTAVEVSVVVEYGVSIVQVADNIRQGVIDAVEYATGLEVVEVNVTVSDVHLPEEDADTDQDADKGSDRLS
jgi:uncharacterized alkaline shock family protein YloU